MYSLRFQAASWNGPVLIGVRQRPSAPMTPLNRPISPNRRYAVAHGELQAFKTAGKRAGGTVNDTVLAVVAGMLGRYLPQPPERSPVALVPVSVREPNESGELGAISVLGIALLVISFIIVAIANSLPRARSDRRVP